jgi:hypothetical protein
MAKKETNKQNNARVSAVGMIILSLILIMLIRTSFIFILVMLLPSIIAYIADNSAKRHTYITVFLCNLSGLMPFAINLISMGNPHNMFVSLITDPMVWLMVYSAAAFGWILVWGCPYFAEFYYELKATARIAKLEMTQKKLLEEWGPEIKRKD